ncbi:MAG: outer membrane protein assembly factor BamD [Gemmatimonadota bacterium]|nr:outer membrane protein assembly factor BamD [Gemmatimonadota bacterium]
MAGAGMGRRVEAAAAAEEVEAPAGERARRGRQRPWAGAALALVPLAAVACGIAMPPPDASPRQRFDWSRERFEQEKYADAVRGLRDHLFRDPLDATSDSARFLLAEAYLRSEQELLAANEFRQFATTRPNSPLADDAQLGTCRAYWALSPDLPRDQEFTQNVVEECTRLLEFFPRSELAPEARRILAAAREKLARKALRVGKWYFDRRLHESAIIYLETILRTWPEAEVVPTTLALLHDAYSTVGFQREADAVRQRLVEAYPESPEARRLGGEEATGR